MLMSQSFVMCGSGTSLEHNLRIKKGGGIRQNGVPERRCLNEHLLMDDTVDKKNYVQNLLEQKVTEVVGDKLATYNEKCIRNRHYNLVRDIKSFIESQQTTRKGKQRSVITEFVIQVGDKYTGCPYDVQTDKQGRTLDRGGRVIPEWDTRRIPGYKDNKVTESKQCKLLKKVYKKYFKEFCKRNPRFVPLSCDIHADENGGVHCHFTGFFVADVKTGLGISLSRTSALAQQYGNNGKGTRTDNAQNRFRQDMRDLLEEVCKGYGIKRKDMHNKEKHRTQKEYYAFADARSEAFEKREKELDMRESELDAKEAQLSRDIAKQEWYILKKDYPDWYKVVHGVYLKKKGKEHNAGLVYGE